MRSLLRISAIVLGVVLVGLIGVTYFLSTKVQYGLIDPSMIPFVSAGLVIIVIEIVLLIILSLSPKDIK